MNTNETSGAMLEALADKYAGLKGTKVIASRVDGSAITFVLEAGPKLTLTEAELTAAILEVQESQAGDRESPPAAESLPAGPVALAKPVQKSQSRTKHRSKSE